MLQKMAASCPPTQFIRELTQNAFDAIDRDREGTVRWTVDDWYLRKNGVRKLCVVDSGSGLYIWPETGGPVKPASDDQRQGIVGSGTIVTLLGHSKMADTIAPAGDLPHRWVGGALGRRYFVLPGNVKLTTPETRNDGSTQPLMHYTAKAHRDVLNERKEASGVLTLPDVLVHWWLLKPRDTKQGAGDRLHPQGAQLSVLHGGEMYQLLEGSPAASRMRDFGMTFGTGRLALHLEPLDKTISPDMARGRLLKAGAEDLPWETWSELFRDQMPAELAAYQQAFHQGRDPQALDDQKKRFQQLFSELGIGRYRRQSDGNVHVDPADTGAGGTKSLPTEQAAGAGHSPAGTRGATAGHADASSEQPQGDRAKRLQQIDMPTYVIWKDSRNRDEADPDDRAASFVEATKTLIVYEDFRGYTTLRTLLLGEYKDVLGGEAEAERQLRSVYEDMLLETVIAARAVGKGSAWDSDQRAAVLSPEALTAAALNRGWILHKVRSAVNRRVGKPATAS